ncbi:uncharacterized protein LOC100199803 isoform X3 [Hydra vulgaris]|uniref:Uncharacterized protein LOC100199803 isoform X3 n=1 Tax=Hydra vulgaris TaxID=6087 RepID=A0ABM4DDR7_HYDVU
MSSPGTSSDNLRRYIDGWLEHKEKRKYLQHWFVLKGKLNSSAQLEKAYLFCFKTNDTKDKSQFVGSTEITFPGGSVVLLKSSKTKFTFKILFNNTKFNFKAYDDQTRQRWIYAFCNLVGKQFPPLEIPTEISAIHCEPVEKKTPLMAPKFLFGHGRSRSHNDLSRTLEEVNSPIVKRGSCLQVNEDKEKRSLNQIAWYYSGMKRVQAEELLSTEAVGSFLLRDSESHSGNFTLTYRDFDKIKNHMICSTEKGQFKFCETEIKQQFNSPSEAAIIFMFTAKNAIAPRAYVRSPTDIIFEVKSQKSSDFNLKYNYLETGDIEVTDNLVIKRDSLKNEKNDNKNENECENNRDSVFDYFDSQSYLEGNYVDDTLTKLVIESSSNAPVLPEKKISNVSSVFNQRTSIKDSSSTNAVPIAPERKISVEVLSSDLSENRSKIITTLPVSSSNMQDTDSYIKMGPGPSLSGIDIDRVSDKDYDLSSNSSSNINSDSNINSNSNGVTSVGIHSEPDLQSVLPDINSRIEINSDTVTEPYMEMQGASPEKEKIAHPKSGLDDPNITNSGEKSPNLPPPRKSVVNKAGKPNSLNLSTNYNSGSKYVNILDTVIRFPPALVSSLSAQSDPFSVEHFYLSGISGKIDSPKNENVPYVASPGPETPPLPPRCDKPLRLSKLS